MKLLKKMVLTAAAVLSVLSANAEGYQINSHSSRQWGMAHTGTALKLGAESMLFNPAGMASMNSKFGSLKRLIKTVKYLTKLIKKQELKRFSSLSL